MFAAVSRIMANFRNVNCWFVIYRRCRNRKVANGLQFKLHVFLPRLASTTSVAERRAEDSVQLGEEDYGVLSRDAIPAGSFVCEVNGQYVLEGKFGLESLLYFLYLLICLFYILCRFM